MPNEPAYIAFNGYKYVLQTLIYCYQFLDHVQHVLHEHQSLFEVPLDKAEDTVQTLGDDHQEIIPDISDRERRTNANLTCESLVRLGQCVYGRVKHQQPRAFKRQRRGRDRVARIT